MKSKFWKKTRNCEADANMNKPLKHLEWFHNQLLPKSSPDESTAISSVKFSTDGQYVAYGETNGYLTVMELNRMEATAAKSEPTLRYKPYIGFISHEPDFDCLKSIAIDEKIQHIAWLPQMGPSQRLLSANERTIKLWRMTSTDREMEGGNFAQLGGCRRNLLIRSPSDLRIPHYRVGQLRRVRAREQRVFSRAHSWTVTGLAVTADPSNFMSADHLRILLWNLEDNGEAFNIVDLTPANLEEVTEVITGLDTHPANPSLFAYATSRGCVRLCDMRARALCDKPVSVLRETAEGGANPSLLSDFTCNISDLHFSHNARYLVTRDYLTLKVWDLQMVGGDRAPVEMYGVHDCLKGRLASLYELDVIFDDFKCAWSPDDRYLVTGSYGGMIRLFDRTDTAENDHVVISVSAKDRSTPLGQPHQVSPIPLRSETLSAATRSHHKKRNRAADSGAAAAAAAAVPVAMLEQGDGTGIAVSNKWLHVGWYPGASPLLCLADQRGLHIVQGQ